MYLFSNAKGKLTNEKFVCCPMRSMNLNRSYFRDSDNGKRVCFWMYSPHVSVCANCQWIEQQSIGIQCCSSLFPSLVSFASFFDLVQPVFPLKLSNRTKKNAAQFWLNVCLHWNHSVKTARENHYL